LFLRSFAFIISIGLSKEAYQIITAKTPELHVVTKDPADDRFIECAAALKAQYIVTSDKALRDIGEYMGTKILSPKEFIMLPIQPAI